MSGTQNFDDLAFHSIEKYPSTGCNETEISTEIMNNATAGRSIIPDFDLERRRFDDNDLLRAACDTLLLIGNTTDQRDCVNEVRGQTSEPMNSAVTLNHNHLHIKENNTCQKVAEEQARGYQNTNYPYYVHYPDYVLTMFYDQINGEEKSKNDIKTCSPNTVNLKPSNQVNSSIESPPKKKRKRNKIADPTSWTRQSNVEKRKKGMEYHGVKKIDGKWHYNVVRPAKEIKPFCDCPMSKQSKKILCRNFTEGDRQQLFDQFWKEYDWKQKRTFIKDMVDTAPIKNTKNRKSEISRRGLSFVYHLKHRDGRMRVCKKMFLNTLGISEWMVLHYTDKTNLENPDLEKSSTESDQSNQLAEENLSIVSNEVAEENPTKFDQTDGSPPYINYSNYVPNCEEVNSSSGKPPKKKRKRSKVPDPSTWTRLNEMEKRKKGLEYRGVKKINGKWHYDIVRPAKEMKPFCDCPMSKKSKKIKCRMFKEDNRQELFNQFWQQLDWEQKRKYIRDMVKTVPIKYPKKKKKESSEKIQDKKKTKSIKLSKKKKKEASPDVEKNEILKNIQDEVHKITQSIQYEITDAQDMESTPTIQTNENKNSTSSRGVSLIYHLELDGCKIRVCKKLFLNTLRLTDSQVLNWISKDTSETPKVKKKRQSLRNDEKCNMLKDFLHSLPKLESLNCTKHSRKFYLEPVFQTKKEVYDLYTEKCKELEKEFVSIKKFHEEFEAYNLAIFSSKTEPCDMCASYKTANINEVTAQEFVRNEKYDSQVTNNIFTVHMQA